MRNTPDPTLIRNWIAALRSGHYAQTQGYLRVSNTFCCLGVLCDLVEPKNWQQRILEYDTDYDYVGCFDTPPQAICDLAGLGPRLTDKGGYVPELTAMNDRGIPFPEIADYIEQNILPQAEATDGIKR